MRSRLVATLAVAAVLTACTGGGGGTAQSTSAKPDDSAAVAYMGKVCSAASAFVDAPKTPPGLAGDDPAKLKADMARYMGQMADAFTKSATALREVGPSPVGAGDSEVAAMATTFTDIAAAFADAKTKIEAADAGDPTGGLQAAGDAIAKMDEFVVPLRELDATPELKGAAEKAESCQKLRRVGRSEQPSPSAAAPTT
ncbi:hypothetical protein GCM10022243_65990 [Saccharothrix violaceirubra]|uniref:Small secreted protein n=1 Tax=Saccharothrix violaceirubra TaxID=413306 RepID=A0A7W7WYY4_9PSEU|nr:hypothetical protein [Saccharothrix violaceirubra]MBB4968915.1 hypothetical protein [Saccharothrix violaceirubra]